MTEKFDESLINKLDNNSMLNVFTTSDSKEFWEGFTDEFGKIETTLPEYMFKIVFYFLINNLLGYKVILGIIYRGKGGFYRLKPAYKGEKALISINNWCSRVYFLLYNVF